MAQVLAKQYDRMTCHKPIKISKIDNPAPGQKKKWMRFELDRITPHQCTAKMKEQQEHTAPTTAPATPENGPQIAELANQVRGLKQDVNILISQIQMLSSEVKNKK
jgi:hypothetical protein